MSRRVTDERVENAINFHAIRTTTLNAKANDERIRELFESVFTPARQVEIMDAALFDDRSFEDWRGYIERQDRAAESSQYDDGEAA